MRLGYDITPLTGIRSGVGNYAQYVLSHMAQLHPEWQYLLFSNRPFVDVNTMMPQARLVPAYFPYSRWLWMQFRLPQAIRQSQPDLCHFMNNTAPFWHVVPYVLTIHDVSLFLHSQYHPRSRLLALRWLLPLVARRAAHVVTHSEFARQDIMQVLDVPGEKITTVHAAAADHFRPFTDPVQQTIIRERYQLPEKFVLYVGTIEPRKNLPRLLKAMTTVWCYHPDCPLLLVGPSGWLMEGVLEKEKINVGGKGQVRYLGYVAAEDLPGIYSLACVFAFPSLYEGFGLPPLEAMACGTPVLTSQHSAMAEVCGDAAWLVDPLDEAAIAEGLLMFLEQPVQRELFIERGLAQAQLFSWERTAQETAAIYEQVIRSKPGHNKRDLCV